MSVRPRVYIGRLSSRAREYEVERFFQGYGKIRDIMLKNGFGFVEFDDYRDADDAIHDLNGKLLCGERVVLEIAKGTPRGAGGAFVSGYNPPPPSAKYYKDSSSKSSHGSGRPGYGRPQNGYKLIVENLSSRYNWQDLKDLMDKCGDINYVDAHHYRRNEGVVEFVRKKDMEYAIKKFEGKEINGRKIKLTPETSRYSRSPSPRRHSRSSSREDKKSSKRSRSRSRSRKGSKDGKRYRSKSYSESPPKKSSRIDKNDASPHKSRDSSAGRGRSRSKSGSASPNGNGYRSRSRTGSPDRESRSRSRSP